MFGLIEAQSYKTVYMLIVTVLTFVFLKQYKAYPQDRLEGDYKESPGPVIFLMLFFTLFIGFRPVSGVFWDMGTYASEWDLFAKSHFSFDWEVNNLLFDNFRCFLSSFGFSYYTFFFLIALIYFGGMSWACCELFPKDKVSAFVVCLAAFSTFSYGTNGIKAGAAASLFLVAIAYLDKGKLIGAIMFLLCSLGFHHSMILPILCVIICYFIKNPKYYFIFWVLCFIISFLHIKYFQVLFSGFVDEHSRGYLLGEEQIHHIFGGFRIDFILYSAVPIFLGQKWLRGLGKNNISEGFCFILNLYTLVNSMWLLCMYASFTNRIAYLSWLLYPIVLIYPFLREKIGGNQYKTFRTVAICHLCFTLFMTFIYYA